MNSEIPYILYTAIVKYDSTSIGKAHVDKIFMCSICVSYMRELYEKLYGIPAQPYCCNGLGTVLGDHMYEARGPHVRKIVVVRGPHVRKKRGPHVRKIGYEKARFRRLFVSVACGFSFGCDASF